ncbi:hypothetical protein LEP1GSC165_1630 [Leptospira santarosai str. CBC523]|nr:hypothetical protein LEP1GSC165_1630 [Leptospira santarosai str. CBC523]
MKLKPENRKQILSSCQTLQTEPIYLANDPTVLKVPKFLAFLEKKLQGGGAKTEIFENSKGCFQKQF